MTTARVAVLMGSSSDYPIMKGAVEMLDRFGVSHVVKVLSAHRTPHDMLAFGAAAESQGFEVLIAGAGGAAHLPGMLASVTALPVIGVPIGITKLQGADSLLSIVQMPAGIPVATVAIDNARNAGLLAVRMLGIADASLRRALHDYADELAATARSQNDGLGAEKPDR
jgi:phosphoribosylaminoimidazole carboxylase PurE protein